ncbi:MAG TPA: hypothetical protein VM243_07050 [Phycisphaerae bacterium]|nr:hypothetical protein [Phycisphaerae bacterium]
MLLGPIVGALFGCQPRSTKFFIDDHRDGASATRYFEAFPECYYCIDAHKHVDIVGLRRTGGDTDNPGTEPAVQVIHIRQVWEANPGTTFAEESMINATVNYMIVGPEGGMSFEGGGFVSHRENRHETELTGKLESSALTPLRQAGAGSDLFERVAVTGTFVAQRDKRQVVRILNEMKRLFGPRPRYFHPPTDPDLR